MVRSVTTNKRVFMHKAYNVMAWGLTLTAVFVAIGVARRSAKWVIAKKTKATASYVIWDMWSDGSSQGTYIDKSQDDRRTSKTDVALNRNEEDIKVVRKGGQQERVIRPNRIDGLTSHEVRTTYAVEDGAESLLSYD